MRRCENHVLVLPQGYFFRLVPDLFLKARFTISLIVFTYTTCGIVVFSMSDTSEKSPIQILMYVVNSKQDFDANFSIEFRK